MSGIELGDMHDAIDKLRTYMNSREYWIIIGATEIASEIEERFYSGQKMGDFHLLAFPSVKYGILVAFFMAHKKHMSSTQFEKFLTDTFDFELPVGVKIGDPKRDLLILNDGTHETHAEIQAALEFLSNVE